MRALLTQLLSAALVGTSPQADKSHCQQVLLDTMPTATSMLFEQSVVCQLRGSCHAEAVISVLNIELNKLKLRQYVPHNSAVSHRWAYFWLALDYMRNSATPELVKRRTPGQVIDGGYHNENLQVLKALPLLLIDTDRITPQGELEAAEEFLQKVDAQLSVMAATNSSRDFVAQAKGLEQLFYSELDSMIANPIYLSRYIELSTFETRMNPGMTLKKGFWKSQKQKSDQREVRSELARLLEEQAQVLIYIQFNENDAHIVQLLNALPGEKDNSEIHLIYRDSVGEDSTHIQGAIALGNGAFHVSLGPPDQWPPNVQSLGFIPIRNLRLKVKSTDQLLAKSLFERHLRLKDAPLRAPDKEPFIPGLLND